MVPFVQFKKSGKKKNKNKKKTGRSVTLSKVGAFHVFSIVQMVPLYNFKNVKRTHRAKLLYKK